jgi:myo-inositol catabolism protein IolC
LCPASAVRGTADGPIEKGDTMSETPSEPGVAAASAAARPLLLLADDHRNSLERDLYRLTAAPTPAEAARISFDKMLIYQAFLGVVAELSGEAQPGILIDEQYGATIAELASRTGGAISLAMPIEASGEEWFHFAYGKDWQAHAGFFDTDHAKVLIRDNLGLDQADREQQAERLAQVSEWSAANHRALIIELLVPASPADLAAVGGDTDRYDRELRPGHTVAIIEYLQDRGAAPAFWKVEGLDRHEDAVAIVAAAKRGGRTADCIVLGRHASREKLDRWLDVAAPVPGFTGFAIGRSIWWDALDARLQHRGTDEETRTRVASAYLEFARHYLDARRGSTAPGPGRQAK